MRRRAMRRCWRLGRRSAAGVTAIATGAQAGEHGSPWGGCHRRPTRACCRLRRRRATGAAVPRGGALPGPSARYLRGSGCRRAVPCEPAGAVCAELLLASQPSMRVHRSSERVGLPMPRPSPYDAHVLTPGSATRCRWRRCTGTGPPRDVHSMRSAAARTCAAVRCASVGAWGDEMPLASPQVPLPGEPCSP